MNELRILQPHHSAEIEGLERSWLSETVPEESERELISWHASWRKESLEHYLPLGWSFGVWNNEQLVGYFIAQPQLFVCGLTQVLWVERLAAQSPEVISELIETAYKLCREKHLQKAIFHMPESAAHSAFQLHTISDILYELKALKY